MDLPKTLKAWRNEKGMNQRDAASALGVDFTYISKIENGHLEPSVDLIERMSFVYSRTNEDRDDACILKGELPKWIKPLVLANPHVLHNLRLSNRIWKADRAAGPKEYA